MARRGENIYKRKDGRWEGRILLKGKSYKYLYGKSYKEIREKMKSFQDNKVCLDEKHKNNQNAAELLEDWLREAVSGQLKPSTYESYYRCVHKYILPFFRMKGNEKISKESVTQLVKSIGNEPALAESSKKKVLSILKLALKAILKDSPESAVIAEVIKLPKVAANGIQVFSVKEQRLIEEVICNSPDKRSLGILLCLYTGIRLGELCALRWSDMDLDAGMMSIRRTVCRTKNFDGGEKKTGLSVGTPKSLKSVRKIPLPAFLVDLVVTYRPFPEDETCYIMSGNNVPMDPRSFQKLFKNILNEANLQERKFHTLRHTFATRALELGIDIKTVSEILGHANVSTTLNIYAHSLVEHKKAAIKKFNDMHFASLAPAPIAV